MAALLLEGLFDGGKDDKKTLTGAKAIATGLGVDELTIYSDLELARSGGGGLCGLQWGGMRDGGRVPVSISTVLG